jgi:hypothetical protein
VINVDIADNTQVPIDVNTAKYNNIRDNIIRTIKDTFFMTYGINLNAEHIIICESKDENANIRKYSDHIIIDLFKVRGYLQSREFTHKVITYLAEPYRQFLDAGVNKRI